MMTFPQQRIRLGLGVIKVPSPTIPPATTTNAWLLGQRSPIIVDPAARNDADRSQLIDQLADDPPSMIFLTHHHHDHIGSALALQEAYQIPIAGHPITETLLQFTFDLRVEEDDVLQTETEDWMAIHTPGHAPGHLCLLSQMDATLVAGDMVAGEGTILINPAEGSLREYLHSLEKLMNRQPSQLLPAHGPVLKNGVSLLQHYITHRKMRLSQILSLLTESPLNEREIAQAIYTQLPVSMLAIASLQVRCGLLYLQEEQQVIHLDDHWVVQ